MSSFKIGDVVMLKSGGPPMTIIGIAKNSRVEAAIQDLMTKMHSDNDSSDSNAVDTAHYLVCAWFKDDIFRHKELHPDTLAETTVKSPPTTFVGWLRQEHENKKSDDPENTKNESA